MKGLKGLRGMILVFLFFAGIGILGNDTAVKAAVAAKVNYVDEVVTAYTSGSSIYVSVDKQKNWDKLEVKDSTNKNKEAEMDISSVLGNKEVTIYFKEKLEDAATEVKLNGQDKIKAKTGVSGSALMINVTDIPSGRKIEYRRGNGSKWTEVVPANKGTTAEINVNKYTIAGATFTIRLKAETDQRIGKEVKVKVAKKANAPNIKFDGSKLALSGFKAGGTEYRFPDKDTNPYIEAGEKVMAIEKIFKVIPPKAQDKNSTNAAIISQAGISAVITGGTIEVRTMATEKKGASRSRYVVVNGQEGFNSDVKFTSVAKKNATVAAIVVQDAAKDKPYEYTLVAGSTTSVDLTKQKWTAITTNGEVVLKKTAGEEPEAGVIILIRKKSTVDKATKAITPASTCYQKKL